MNIHTLNLNGCHNITDNSIKYLSNVHILSLNLCTITDKSVKCLVNIHTLDLYGCKNITDKCVKYLRSRDVQVII